MRSLLRRYRIWFTDGSAMLAACFTETNTKQYESLSILNTAGNLAVNLVVQVVAITAMRSIGLFYRHYACYFSY